jgi:hypothetical protein
MIVYLIVAGSDADDLDAKVALLRPAYLDKMVRGRNNPDGTVGSEAIGVMQYNNAHTKAFTGTARAALEEIADLADERVWLTIITDPDFMRDAEWIKVLPKT